MADDDSGIPQYTIGSSRQLSGAGRTASGLAMMSEAACRVINMCICDLGLNLIIPVVKNTHVYNLLNSTDMLIKGDVEINPSGRRPRGASRSRRCSGATRSTPRCSRWRRSSSFSGRSWRASA